MGTLGSLVVRIAGDHSSLKKSIDESTKGITKFGKDLFKLGMNITKYVALPLAGLAVAGINAFKKQEQAEVKLGAALQATGNQIGITKSQLISMAGEMSNMTAIADEAIIEAQGLMATFTQIGGKVFPDAIKAAADMSAMFGQDMKQSAIQLGTALNDPIAGIGRLKRIGISFTEEQKNMIKGFVESGDMMSAQRVILKELGDEFGGVAEKMGESSTGALKKFQNNMGDLLEMIGSVTLDLLKPGLDMINKFLTENKSKILGIFKNFPEIIQVIGSHLGSVLKEALTGRGFKDVMFNMSQLFVVGFKTAIAVFTTLLGSAISSVPDLFVAAMSGIGNILVQSITGALAPEYLLPKKTKNEFIKWSKEMGKTLVAPWDTWEGKYKEYSKTWEETQKVQQEANDSMDKALGNVFIKADQAIGNLGEVFTRLEKEAKPFLKGLSEGMEKVGKGEELQKLLKILDDIIAKEQELEDQREENEQAELERNQEQRERASETLEELNDKYAYVGRTVTDTTEEMIQKQEEFLAKVKETADEMLSFVDDMINKLRGLWTQYFENRSTEIENNYQKEKEAIEQSTMNEEEKEKALEKLDEKYDKKRKKLKQAQFKAEKAANIIKAIIDTASAIIEALPNIPLSITAGALGVAQTALIASQPVPQFKQGGSMVVPPGYNDDNYLIGVSSGERVNVQTKNQMSNPINLSIVVMGEKVYNKITEATRNRQILIYKDAIVER